MRNSRFVSCENPVSSPVTRPARARRAAFLVAASVMVVGTSAPGAAPAGDGGGVRDIVGVRNHRTWRAISPTPIPPGTPVARRGTSPPAANTGDLVYENDISPEFFYPPRQDNVLVMDDLYRLDLNNPAGYSVTGLSGVLVFSDGKIPYNMNVDIWSDDGSGQRPVGPIQGTQVTFNGLPPGQIHELAWTYDVPVKLPAGVVWICYVISDGNSGPIIANEAEIGFTEDFFWQQPPFEILTLKGSYAGFCARMFAKKNPDEGLGACCDGTTGTCTDRVPPEQCVGDQRVFYRDLDCKFVELKGLCEEHTGACCDGTTGICVSNVPESQCPTAGTGAARRGQGQACADCGPGDHWIDACPAGDDIMNPTGAVLGLDLLTDGNLDGQVDQNIIVSGPTTIRRGAGDAATHRIETEIIQMSLTGGGIKLTAGVGQGTGVLQPSLGTIIEQEDDPALALSSFDVFFEVDLGGGTFVYNQVPLKIESEIDCVPPKASYIHVITAPIPLFTSPVGGTVVAQLVTARHITFPDQFRWEKDTPCEELVPPCTEHTGACCDASQPGGFCQDDVPESQCPTDPADPDNQYRWEKDTRCVDLVPPCEEHTGACCDASVPVCLDDVPESVCLFGLGLESPKFFKGQLCDDVFEDCVNQGIPKGSDCWRTRCPDAAFSFCKEHLIPAGFFGVGSDPFEGTVELGGSGDNTDTIMKRLEDMDLPSIGSTDKTAIKLEELNLQSCQPINISFGGGKFIQQWDVAVELSDAANAEPGLLTATKTHANGGTFRSSFNVIPKFTFTQRSNPNNRRILDMGAEGFPAMRLATIGEIPWVHATTNENIKVCGVNFIPGIDGEADGGDGICCPRRCHGPPEPEGHRHCTVPPGCPECPGGACCVSATVCVLIPPGDDPNDCANFFGGQYLGNGTNCDDIDGDGLADEIETGDCNACPTPELGPCHTGTDPNNPDTDDDGVDDGDEIEAGTDPCEVHRDDGIVPKGSDCWRTECGRTKFSFCKPPIPADFFGPGSDPFEGVVFLGGAGGNTDTSIKRLEQMDLRNVGDSDKTLIKLETLDLIGCAPITVTFNGGTSSQQWNVTVAQSTAVNVPAGLLTAIKTHDNGGTFRAEFNVQPVFTFTRVGGSDVRVLDTGAEGTPPVLLETVGNAPWVHTVRDPGVKTCGENFAPGVEEDPATGNQCCKKVGHSAGVEGHIHETGPPDCTGCPEGACCFKLDGSCQVVGPGQSTTAEQECINLGGQYKGDETNCDDTDGDGLPDVVETADCNECPTPDRDACNTGTDPNNPDTDGDGVNDGDEIAAGTDPCEVHSLGACCCFEDGDCVDTTAAECSGRFLGPGTSCADNGDSCCEDNGRCPSPGCCPLVTDTVGPGAVCGADGVVGLFDIIIVLDQFAGLPHPCCEASSRRPQGTALEQPAPAVVTLTAPKELGSPGDVFEVDVYGDGLVDLGSYQVAVHVTGGRQGRLDMLDPFIDAGRANDVFADASSLPVIDTARHRIARVVLQGRAGSRNPVYLGTFTFRASDRAEGTFDIVLTQRQTMLTDSARQPIEIRSAVGATITIR